MKNSNFFLLAVTAATVVSCGTHPSSYTINGTVSDTTLNGNKVYLTDMASRNVLDSAVIANGKFTFTGKADTALICQIQSRPYRMELVLENGDIAVEMGETDKRLGTPLNDSFALFMSDMDSLQNTIIAKQQKIMQKGLSEEELREAWQDFQTNTIMPEFNRVMSENFDRNKDNAVGAWAIANWNLGTGSIRFRAQSRRRNFEGQSAYKNDDSATGDIEKDGRRCYVYRFHDRATGRQQGFAF